MKFSQNYSYIAKVNNYYSKKIVKFKQKNNLTNLILFIQKNNINKK